MSWRLVTANEPSPGDYPVTVVKSKTRDVAVWRPYGDGVLTSLDKRDISRLPWFEDGELLEAEDWYAKPS